MASKMGKYFNRMKTLMKTYKFDDKASISVLRAFVQFKGACDSNEVSEGMALSVMPNFMTYNRASSFTARKTLHGNG